MKYIRVEWPEIQDYMDDKRYSDQIGFDPIKNCWFVPEDWYYEDWDNGVWTGCDIGDLEDAMG